MHNHLISEELRNFIEDTINTNDVVVFMKGTTKIPQCGFSGLVVQIFNHLGVEFKDINILENAELREAVKIYSDWPTIPQIYIKKEFVGGSDILREMFSTKELHSLLKDKEIKFKD